MYYIIKDIQKNIKNVIIVDLDNEDNTINISRKELEIGWNGNWFKATKKYDTNMDGYYQSCYLRSDKMNGKMSILQDYGDHECGVGDYYLEYPRGILGIPDFCSIGWYDGKLYAIDIANKETLLAVPFAKFEHEIEIEKLRCKRPYNLKIIVSSKMDLDEKPKCEVFISSKDKPEDGSIYGMWHVLDYIDENVTLRDMLKPESFYLYYKMMTFK